jgi:hypothetical protein
MREAASHVNGDSPESLPHLQVAAIKTMMSSRMFGDYALYTDMAARSAELE